MGQNSIDPKMFNDTFNKGNVIDYATILPGSKTVAQFLTGHHLEWAQKANDPSLTEKKRTKYYHLLQKEGIKYYVVEINYEYKINEKPSLLEAVKFFNEDRTGRGLIMQSLSQTDIDYVRSFYDVRGKDKYGLCEVLEFVEKFSNDFDPNTGAAGQSEGYKDWGDFNVVLYNPKQTTNISKTEIIVHEAGHNSAKSHKHAKGFYMYSQPGLQSNESGKIYPTQENTRAIIQDKTNTETTTE